MNTKKLKQPKTLIPLLVKYKERYARLSADHQYDDKLELNMVLYRGKLLPVVTIPGSLAMLKTRAVELGED